MRDELFFKIVDKDKNENTQLASRSPVVGYYVLVDEGVKIEEPLQAAFLFGTDGDACASSTTSSSSGKAPSSTS
ncbi:MAG: hypothetical protein MZV49_15425 [Rhodopseudomonas palustris]|nr:hypothetical protein [Rhodopseudomonas palustris]